MALPLNHRIFLVRHGQTEGNLVDRLQGCTLDSPLTQNGRAHAVAIAGILRRGGAGGLAFACSPVGRAQATAHIVLQTLGRRRDFIVDERLRELDFGDWTGLTIAETNVRHAEAWAARQSDPWRVRPPGGECYADVAERLLDWVRALDQDIVAVSHGIAGRILRGLALGLDGPAMRRLDEPHDGVFCISPAGVERLVSDGATSGNDMHARRQG